MERGGRGVVELAKLETRWTTGRSLFVYSWHIMTKISPPPTPPAWLVPHKLTSEKTCSVELNSLLRKTSRRWESRQEAECGNSESPLRLLDTQKASDTFANGTHTRQAIPSPNSANGSTQQNWSLSHEWHTHSKDLWTVVWNVNQRLHEQHWRQIESDDRRSPRATSYHTSWYILCYIDTIQSYIHYSSDQNEE